MRFQIQMVSNLGSCWQGQVAGKLYFNLICSFGFQRYWNKTSNSRKLMFFSPCVVSQCTSFLYLIALLTLPESQNSLDVQLSSSLKDVFRGCNTHKVPSGEAVQGFFNGFLCLHLTLHLLPCSLVRVTTLQLVLSHSPCGFHVGLLRHASPLQPGQPSASGFTCSHCLDDGLVRSKTQPNRGLNPYQTNLCPPSSHLFI